MSQFMHTGVPFNDEIYTALQPAGKLPHRLLAITNEHKHDRLSRAN